MKMPLQTAVASLGPASTTYYAVPRISQHSLTITQQAQVEKRTNWDKCVEDIDVSYFFSDDFGQNHLFVSNVDQEDVTCFAKAERVARDRNLDDSTVICENYGQLGEEARRKNLTGEYYRKIKRGSGIPAETFFTSDKRYPQVVCKKTDHDNYDCDFIDAKIRYTVKNDDMQSCSEFSRRKRDKMYMINHLENSSDFA